MAWHVPFWNWLAHAAAGALVVLAVGCLAAILCRQPVRRLRLIELTLLGCLLTPWLSLLSGLPQWSLGVLSGPEPPAVTAAPDNRAGEHGFEDRERLDRAVLAARAEQSTEEKAAAVAPAPLPSEPVPALPETPKLAAASGLATPATVVMSYAIASAGLLAWWLVGLVQLIRLLRSTVPAPTRVAALFRTVAGDTSKGVRLLVSDRIELPLTFSWRRPVIVIPGSLCQSGDEAALRYCLAHEWSHVERRDIWAWHLATLAQVLFFYQPLFWWLRRQLRLCQDYLADARAAEQAAVAEDYAEYLVGLARRRLGNPVPAALGIGDRRSNLYRRITMLLTTRQPLEQRCRRAWNVAWAAGILALLAAVAAVRLDAASPADDKKESAKQEEAKDKPKGEPIKYTGRVFDKHTDKNIPGAVVTVRRATYGDPKGERVIEETKHETNAEGKYTFTVPPEQAAERYLYIELDVAARGYAPRSHFGYSFAMIQKNEKMGGRPFFENVDLRPAAEITGIVETPEGKPAAGVKVQAYSNTSKTKQGEFEYGSFADTKTDKDGKFSLWIITPGPAVFWVLPETHAPSTHVIKDPTKRGDVGRFVMNPGIVLKGKVLDVQGKPLAGVFVEADKRGGIEDFNLPVADHIRRTAVTNDKGEFAFAPLPAATYDVYPQERGWDPSKDEKRPQKRPLPGVFVRQQVTLKDGMPPEPKEPIEVRAVPHVVIEAQFVDSKGAKTRGHAPHLFGRMNKNDFWFGEGKMDENGKMTLLVPHGLTDARLSLSTNEHGVLRWKKGKDGQLSASREIMLGTLTDDSKDIEITRYVAPILIMGAVEKGGGQLKNLQAKIEYAPDRKPRDRNGMFINGVQGDVFMEKQEDGRWRSSQLLPDEEITVTVSAEGYKPYTEKLKLAEGTTKELKAELEKSTEPEKKEAEKKKDEEKK
jgi:beta-lactamase regulating signal transducer with metallopeptidase domain/protocatechuate 3,4-dioxygenase beta subunit